MPLSKRTYIREKGCRGKGAVLSSLLACVSLLVPTCSSNHESGPKEAAPAPSCIPGVHYEYYRMDFGLDYRDLGTLIFQSTCDQLEGTFTLTKGNPFVKGGESYSGKGTLYRFPETGDNLYTMKFHGNPVPAGSCSDKEVSLSLSLSSKKGSSYLVGGLTAYCGKDLYYGTPARVMRMSGTMENDTPARD